MPRKINEHDVQEFFGNVFVCLAFLFVIGVIIFVIINVGYVLIVNPVVGLWILGTICAILFVIFADEIIVWFWNKFIAKDDENES